LPGSRQTDAGRASCLNLPSRPLLLLLLLRHVSTFHFSISKFHLISLFMKFSSSGLEKLKRHTPAFDHLFKTLKVLTDTVSDSSTLTSQNSA
jgi:hypothetical protein